MRALILSAGLGERLRPLTLKRAKPAIEFLNMPMLAFPYFWFEPLGLEEIVFNTHYLPDTVRHAAMLTVAPEINLRITHEPQILGSGGGIWNARAHLSGVRDFAVANGDAVVAFKDDSVVRRMLEAHRAQKAFATMLVCPLEGVGSKIPGVWMNSAGEVAGFGKTAPAEGMICRHYASFMFISERVWKYLPAGESNILYDVFMAAIRDGEKVLGFEDKDLRWFETGNAADYLRATQTCLEFLRAGDAYGANLRRMLERFQPEFEVFSDLKNRRLCAQQVDTKIQGFAVIGADAELANASSITDSVVLPGARAEGEIQAQVLI